MELPFQTAESQSLLWWTLLQPAKPHTNGEHGLRVGCGCGCCCVMTMGSALYLLQNQTLATASNNIFRPTQGVSPNHGLGWECPSALSWSLCPPHARHSLIDPPLPLGCESLVLQQKGTFVPTNAESTSPGAGNIVDWGTRQVQSCSSCTQLIGRLPGWFDGLAMKLRFKGTWVAPVCHTRVWRRRRSFVAWQWSKLIKFCWAVALFQDFHNFRCYFYLVWLVASFVCDIGVSSSQVL